MVKTYVSDLREMCNSIDEQAETDGFFSGPAWKVLSKEIELEGGDFYKPNPGVFYGEIHSIVESVLTAAKSERSFSQLAQEGYRCTMCAEREWISDTFAFDGVTDEAPDARHVARQNRREIRLNGKTGTIWHRVAEEGNWKVRAGEHLCAICTLKRIWPAIVEEKVSKLTGKQVRRQIVSTRAMAVASSISRAMDVTLDTERTKSLDAVEAACVEAKKANLEQVTLPKKLNDRLRHGPENSRLNETLRILPSLIDLLSAPEGQMEGRKTEIRRKISSGHPNLRKDIRKLLLGKDPEPYFAVLFMDGDNIGEWLSGRDKSFNLKYRDSWHTKIKSGISGLEAGNPALKEYLDSYRITSPSRHVSISTALSNFSTNVTRFFVEERLYGQLIYSGGDDVLAFLPVTDALGAIEALRYGFSGTRPSSPILLTDEFFEKESLSMDNGWIKSSSESPGNLRRLQMVMGAKATASVGVAIAHHSTPLSVVLAKAREAESIAKASGRNAFSVRIIKRSGGDVGIVGSFEPLSTSQAGYPTALYCLDSLGRAISSGMFSRKFTYAINSWISDFPPMSVIGDEELWKETMESGISYQLRRQATSKSDREEVSHFVESIPKLIVELAVAERISSPGYASRTGDPFVDTITSLFEVAEFLGRQSNVSSRYKAGEM